MCIYIHVYMCGFFTCNINVGKNAVCRDVKKSQAERFFKGVEISDQLCLLVPAMLCPHCCHCCIGVYRCIEQHLYIIFDMNAYLYAHICIYLHISTLIHMYTYINIYVDIYAHI